MQWEKEEGATPNAQALQALAQSGFDVLYVVTGRRERRLPAAEEAYNPVSAQAFCDKLERRFDQIEPWPLEPEVQEQLASERNELTRIATIEALPDHLRARADQMLVMAFEDEEAVARQVRRFRQLTAAVRLAEAVLDEAAEETGKQMPPSLREPLLTLVRKYKIGPTDLHQLMDRLSRHW